ncbi:MAG TPA: FkbM family methyltransferase [Candidatus Acidoferrum sp.]|nr:FkbM family methyltransferase [Candidatus Acidoferrum sp.]
MNSGIEDMSKGAALPSTLRERVRYFFAKQGHEKVTSLCGRINRIFRWAPVPVRLPLGFWWLAHDDHVSNPLREGWFERAETAFVSRFLKPGMRVLDVGAHHGLYTVLASKRVSPGGRIVAFEPSPRERKALRWHLRLNHCWNVRVNALALGDEEKDVLLYLASDKETGCNSLRPPNVTGGAAPIRVHVTRLDDWMARNGGGSVDFIKLDVEGGELSVLRGAERFLEKRPRPVILAEVQEIRTAPWGYRAKEIIQHLARKDYQWFSLAEDGALSKLDVDAQEFDGNFVAWPKERSDGPHSESQKPC